jgi:hypothetical protein
MLQMISHYGVVESYRRLDPDWTTGWAQLYESGLIDHSIEATIVESADYRRLFTKSEILEMESELRAVKYEPKAV